MSALKNELNCDVSYALGVAKENGYISAGVVMQHLAQTPERDSKDLVAAYEGLTNNKHVAEAKAVRGYMEALGISGNEASNDAVVPKKDNANTRNIADVATTFKESEPTYLLLEAFIKTAGTNQATDAIDKQVLTAPQYFGFCGPHAPIG